jgi:proteasome lid subunit RPN8/RPN11
MTFEFATLSAAQLATLIKEAETAFPAECCGLLLGKQTQPGWYIERVRVIRNASAKPELGFEFESSEQLRVYREADEAGLEILGNYHSHPNDRRGPSPTDLQLARERSDRSLWLILAVANGKFTEASLWQLQDEPGEFQRINFLTEKNAATELRLSH